MEKITSAAALVDEFRSSIDSELPSRWKALDEIMRRLGLDAVLFVGNSAVGPKSYGMFRYFTNHRVYYHLQAFIARSGEAPTVICGTILHKKFFADKGFKDIRIGEAQLENVISTLLEKPVGRLGGPAPADIATQKAPPGHRGRAELSIYGMEPIEETIREKLRRRARVRSPRRTAQSRPGRRSGRCRRPSCR